MSEKTEQMYTEREMAELLSVTPRTLAQWRRKGSGPPWIRVGGSIRYVGLSRWIDEQTYRPGEEEE